MQHTESEPSPEQPEWQHIATDPTTIEYEQRIAEHIALIEETDASSIGVSKYWWNTGVPYVRMDGTARHAHISPLKGRGSSYDQDHPEGHPEASPTADQHQPVTDPALANARYANDPPVHFATIEPVPGIDVCIGLDGRGHKYLVTKRGKVISPGYTDLTYVGDGIFKTPQPRSLPPEIVGQLVVLTDEERTEAYKERARHQTLQQLQKVNSGHRQHLLTDNARHTLTLYGIPAEEINQAEQAAWHPDRDATVLSFARGETRIDIKLERTGLDITAYNRKLGPDYHIESGGQTDERFTHLHITCFYPSRAIPIALHLIDLPHTQRYEILGPPHSAQLKHMVTETSLTNRPDESSLPRPFNSIHIEAPGAFSRQDNTGTHTYHLDAAGVPIPSDPSAIQSTANEAIKEALYTVEASRVIAHHAFQVVRRRAGNYRGSWELSQPALRDRLQLPPLEHTGNAHDATRLASILKIHDQLSASMATVQGLGELASDLTNNLDVSRAILESILGKTNTPASAHLTAAADELQELAATLREGLQHLQQYREDVG